MQKQNLFILLICLAVSYGNVFAQDSVTVFVTVEGFENERGVCRLLLFENEKGFPDSPEFALLKLSLNIKQKKAECGFKIIPGKYAITVLHDENVNGEMDTNWLGIPKEGFGFSNNPKIGFSPPEFDESAVNLVEKNYKIQIKLYYM